MPKNKDKSNKKKRSRGDTTYTPRDLLEKLRGNIPLDMLLSTLNNMNAMLFELDGFPIVLTLEAAVHLKSILGKDHSISEINTSNCSNAILQGDDLEGDDLEGNDLEGDELLEKYEELSPHHLSGLESYGDEGLESLMGAVLVSGNNRFRITCAETYCRDIDIDPHGEPSKSSSKSSSSPTEEPTTQYPGELKITFINDNFDNEKLVIGVRAANYLTTGGFCNGEIFLGPGRCATAFSVDHTTRIYFPKIRRGVDFSKGDILSLGQLRSHFGHIATYVPRRGALKGYGTLKEMPATIFTLSQMKVRYSRIFRRLAVRAQRENVNEISLHMEDIEKPLEGDDTPAAIFTQKLIKLFPSGQQRIVITGNEKAEKALTALANSFSNTISDRNKTKASAINKKILPHPHLPKKSRK